MKTRGERRAVTAASLLALLAMALLPWARLPAGMVFPPLPGGLVADARSAAAFWQALLYGKWPLLAGAAAPLLCLASLRLRDGRAQGRLWMAAGFGGCAVLLAFAAHDAAHSRTALGMGAAAVMVCLLAQGAIGLAKAGGFFRGDLFASTLAVLAGSLLLLFVGYPLARGLAGALTDAQGRLGVAEWAGRLTGDRIWSLDCLAGAGGCGVAWNTLFLALLTATGTTLLGALLALAELRSGSRKARAVRVLAPLPFMVPPFVAALALILLFGRSGLVSQLLESLTPLTPGRWIYGLPGLWLAQLLTFTPITYLILRSALAAVSPRLEESAQALGASPGFTLRRVTLPLAAPGLAQAFLTGFLESIGDFGSPIVIGGSYAVLSTEIFYAIVGVQFAEGRNAALLALVLAFFALVVFSLQRASLRGRDFAGPGGTGVPVLLPARARPAVMGAALAWLALTIGLYACAFGAAFVEVWGRDFTPTLGHMERAFGLWRDDGGGLALTGIAWPSLLNTLQLAGIAGPLTAAASILLAWLLQRHRFPGRATLEYVVLMAIAVPGTVLGLCYVLVFSRPPVELTGTALLIVLCLVLRNLPVAVGICGAAFRQLDPALEEASRTLGASGWRSFLGIALPQLRGAVASALVYSWVRSMTTLSAVVFLVTAETELATTYIIQRAGQGDWGVAFAYSVVLVLLLSLGVAAANRLLAGVRLGAPARPVQLGAPP